MTITKNLLWILFFGIFACINLSSCNDDDEEDDNSSREKTLLLGTWQGIDEKFYNGDSMDEVRDISSLTYTFYDDNTMTRIDPKSSHGYGEGTYSISGNTLKMTYTVIYQTTGERAWTEKKTVQISEISESKLVWNDPYEDYEYDYSIATFEKVN